MPLDHNEEVYLDRGDGILDLPSYSETIFEYGPRVTLSAKKVAVQPGSTYNLLHITCDDTVGVLSDTITPQC